MSKEKQIEIEVVTYEEARLTFFKAQRDIATKRYEQFQKSKSLKELPPMEQHRLLSIIGERLSFWNDIIEMLENCYRKQSEGEWISRHHMSRSARGRYTSYNTYICGVCRKANGRRKTPFCPHCGAKMKGGE